MKKMIIAILMAVMMAVMMFASTSTACWYPKLRSETSRS